MSYLSPRQWQDMQIRVFTKWCNLKLSSHSNCGLRVKNLVGDLGDGLVLIKLYEVLTGKPCAGANLKPGNLRIVKVNNVGLVLEAIQSEGVNLTGISRENIVDGNQAAILGLLWNMIQHFQLHKTLPKTSGQTCKARLLAWINEKIKPTGMELHDLNNGFKDGSCLCALLNTFKEGLVDLEKLDKEKGEQNLGLAFSLAEKELGIPSFLEPSDFEQVTAPDEPSIMTYLSLFAAYDPSAPKLTISEETVPSPKEVRKESTDMVEQQKDSERGEEKKQVETVTKSDESEQQKEKGKGKETTKDDKGNDKGKEKQQSSESNSSHHTVSSSSRDEEQEASRTHLECDIIPRLLFARGRVDPKQNAHHFKTDEGWEWCDWATYCNLVRTAARALIALGLEAGAKVCMYGKTRPEWNIFYVAAIAAGGIPTSLGSTTCKKDIAGVIDHSESTFLLLEKHSQWKKKIQPDIQAKKLPHLKRVLVIESAGSPDYLTWKQFLRKGKGATFEEELQKRLEASKVDDVAAIVYTPGTLGKRKPVMLTHKSLYWTAQRFAEAMEITERDCYLSFLSMSHVEEQILALHIPLLTGMTVYFAPDITCLQTELRLVQPTILAAPPEFWLSSYLALQEKMGGTEEMKKAFESQPLLPDLTRKAIGCGRVKRALIGGNSQPAPVEVFRFFELLGITLLQTYGHTETCGMTACNLPRSHQLETVGAPLKDCELKIENGEILVRGPNVFAGYFKDEELTTEVLKDGWFHTGDMGEIQNGNLVLRGRKSDAITLADGTEIMPMALETALRAFPLIRYAAVYGQGKEYLVALLILDFAMCKRWAKTKGVSPRKLLSSPEIMKQIKECVDAANTKCNLKDGVRRFSILPRNLLVKKGELTPTMSLNRETIQEHFAAVLEKLYSKEEEGAEGGATQVETEPLKVDMKKEEEKGQQRRGGRLTDGTFYKKISSDEYKKTNLTQEQVEDMERRLAQAMKEIRELAKRIKNLQERHVEDSNVIEAKEDARMMLELELECLAEGFADGGANGSSNSNNSGGGGGGKAGKKKSKSAEDLHHNDLHGEEEDGSNNGKKKSKHANNGGGKSSLKPKKLAASAKDKAKKKVASKDK